MRREKDIPVTFSDNEEGFLKKGTGITSIFKKLKTLSRKKDFHDVVEAESDDDQHISLSAADSVEQEAHSVTIYDGDGAEAVLFDADAHAEADHESRIDAPAFETTKEWAMTQDTYEVQVEDEFESPRYAPEFVIQEYGEPLEYPEPVIEDARDYSNAGEQIESSFPQETNGGFEVMYDENDGSVTGDGEVWGSHDQDRSHEHQHFEDSEAQREEESNGRSGDSDANELRLSPAELEGISSPLEFVEKLSKQGVKAGKFVRKLKYEETLRGLQHECSKLQETVKRNGQRVVVIFEGMELSGKYDTIRKATKYMDPTGVRVVSLSERTEEEKQQWFFERYTKHLPKNGEIVFFNRSWYDRGVHDPIHGLCTDEEYGHFLSQAPEFEYMLIENGYKVIKIWLSVTSKQQNKRLRALAEEGLRNWKLSPFDESYLERWSKSRNYRNLMFSWTDKNYSPWIIVSAKKRKRALVEAIRHILSTLDYDGKQDATVSIEPDATVVKRFHRSMIKKD